MRFEVVVSLFVLLSCGGGASETIVEFLFAEIAGTVLAGPEVSR